jgi:serine protease Do
MSRWGSRVAALCCLIAGVAGGVWIGYLASEAGRGRASAASGAAQSPATSAVVPAGIATAPPASSATGPPATVAGSSSVADLVERCRPAVVAVGAVIDRKTLLEESRRMRQQYPNMPELTPQQLDELLADPLQPNQRFLPFGSGFFVDAEGSVVTNNHVVAELLKREMPMAVRTSDDRLLKAELVGADEETDVAALRVPEAKGVRFVEWADSDSARVGDYVVAIGSPFGLESTVTLGIISAKGRQWVTPAENKAHTFDDYLQTDAAINPGNSGGPLFAMDGRVVGINTAIQTNTNDPSRAGSIGIGFSIPARLASFVSGQILKQGEVIRGYIGVELPSAEIERDRGTLGSGAVLARVAPGQPAEKAGLRAGDVVTEIGGKPIRNSKDLIDTVTLQEVGAAVPVRYLRGGKEMSTEIRVARRPALEDLQISGQDTPQRGQPTPESGAASAPDGSRLPGPLQDLLERVQPGP